MMIRFRISFSKTSAMRYTSHLDLHRTWERTFRRAGLPMVFGQGYNPRPRLQLACALPLGFTSECELLDVWLESEDLVHEDLLTDLEQAIPPGLQIHTVKQIDLQAPALQTLVHSVGYMVILLEPVSDLESRVADLLAVDNLPRQRRGRQYDLRPLIEEIHLLPLDHEEHEGLYMQLVAQEARTGRPEEVLDALQISPQSARVHRTQLLLDDD